MQKDTDRAELDRVMHDYYEWWKDQPTFARNELSTLASPQGRIKLVEQLKKEEQVRNPLKSIPAQDIDVLREWLMKYVKKIDASRVLSMSDEQRKRWENAPEPQRLRALMWSLGQRGPGGGNKVLKLPDNLNELRRSCLPTRSVFSKGSPTEDQWKIIQNWLLEIRHRQFPDRLPRRPGLLVDEKEIAEFFDGLDKDQKAWLLNLRPTRCCACCNACTYRRINRSRRFSLIPKDFRPPAVHAVRYSLPDRQTPNRPEKTEDKMPAEAAPKS